MELEDIKLSSAIKLQEYINTHYKISVDYEQLINEFKQDYNDLNDYILVEFDYGKELEIDIIIDYLNVEDFNPKQNNLRLEYMHKDKLLNLLEEINKID